MVALWNMADRTLHFRRVKKAKIPQYRPSYVACGILRYCGQTAGWMQTPLGTEVDLRAGHIVLDGFPALRERGTAPAPPFRPTSILTTVAHLSYC